MPDNRLIQVFEYKWLQVGKSYGLENVQFRQYHFNLLNEYATENPDCGYFLVYNNMIKFQNYVGVIKVGDLTIEVLPKTDTHQDDVIVWQKVLVEMLAISLKVEAETTTTASIDTRKINVLETYLHLFLKHTEALMHHGLIKKYHTTIENRTALKGKIMVHQHVAKNIVHAERFFVQHQTYDSNNIFNGILYETLNCIRSLQVSMMTNRWCDKLLLNFPQFQSLNISQRLFERIIYDRKTKRYETAIELARIILLNYHPDVKSGNSNILAIMFDMNLLWESYIQAMLYRAKSKVPFQCTILSQRSIYFWKHPSGRTISLRPDFIVQKHDGNSVKRIILDTKWKYRSKTSIEDVRQLYAYGKYFKANERCLVYPEKLEEEKKVVRKQGKFYCIDQEQFNDQQVCDLMFIDLLNGDNTLNRKIGIEMLTKCFQD